MVGDGHVEYGEAVTCADDASSFRDGLHAQAASYRVVNLDAFNLDGSSASIYQGDNYLSSNDWVNLHDQVH